MKLNKLLRFISVIMAAAILAGTLSVGAAALHHPYLDSDLQSNYNSIDQVTLTADQQASLLLDKVDVMLEDKDIYIDIPIIGDIDLRSIDSALSSIYDLTGNWLYGSLTVGDLTVLKSNRSFISSARRTSTNLSDVDVIDIVVQYIAACIPTLVNIIDDSFNWGMVRGFLPPKFRVIISDVPKYIKEEIWDALHPVNYEQYPSNTTLDSIVQFMLDNQLGGKREAVMGFPGVLPGFDVDLETADGYRMLEEAIYCALNEYVVPVINGDLKKVIREAVIANSQKGGDLGQLVNIDYVVAEYSFDKSKGLMEQLNTVLGTVVNQMLTDGANNALFTWSFTPAAGETQADLLEDNIFRLIKVIIPLGGDENYDLTGKGLHDLLNYVAISAVEEFVKHMSLDPTLRMDQVAYLGLRELAASVLPEKSYPEQPASGTLYNDYREAILGIAADLGIYYFNNMFDFNCDPDAGVDGFVNACAEWGLDFAEGLVDVSTISETSTGWDKIDAVLWSIIPKDWIPYGTMFANNGVAGTANDLTFRSLINYFLDSIFNCEFENFYTFFAHNSSSTLDTLTLRQTLINVVTGVVNNAFPGTLPTNITCFEDLMDTDTLKNIVKDLIISIKDKKSVIIPTALNMITVFTGASKEQSLGKADIDIDERVYCENGAVPSGKNIRITNLSKGVNRGWRDQAGVLHQDAMYKIKPIAVTCDNSGVTLAAIPSDTVINANGFYDVAVSGTVSGNSEVRFDLTYDILDEAGAVINPTHLVASVYSYFYTQKGNYEATSLATGEANKVSMDSFPTYLYMTDIYDAAVFSIMATNNGSLLGNAAKDIRRAVVTGTMPAELSANNPESGYIVRLDAASLTVDAYGSVNPYVLDRDPDNPQPYGIYDLSIQFEICAKDASSGTLTEARDHKLVVYNDFGLPGLLRRVMNANRQSADYLNASAEWAAYQSALSAGYALVHGNPDHTKMFACVSSPDGSDNAYKAAADAVNAAVEALDAKVKPTDTAKLAALKATLEAQTSPEGGYFKDVDYKLYTYDRWNKWKRHARRLINSQNVAEGVTAAAITDLDLVYAKHMLELMYPRMLRRAAVKTHLAAAITAAGTKTESAYAADTWADYAAALATANAVNADTSADLRQSEVNDARVCLLKAERMLKPLTLTVPAGSTAIVDSRSMFIHGITESLASLDGYIAAASGYTLNVIRRSGSYVGTGSYVKVMNGDEQVAFYTVILYGDVNGDGVIDEDDFDIISNYLNGTDTEQLFEGSPFATAADVDRDGAITQADYAIINDYLTNGEPINQA